MSIDDKKVIHAMRTMPEVGFRLLMGKYKESIYWHIRRLVVSHEDAQDVSQETFVRIYRSFKTFRESSSLRGWMFRIATNEALRLLQNRVKYVSPGENDVQRANLIPADNFVDYTDAETVKLQKAISSLPFKQQLAFNLRYYDEMDYDEIAKVADSTPSAAKMNYHIAKDKIIKYMNTND